MKVTSYKEEYQKPTEDTLRAYGLNVDVDVVKYHGVELDTSDWFIHGFLRKNPYKDRSYMIFVVNMKVDYLRFIQHECAHIQQYEEGRLSIDSEEKEYWDGVKIDFHSPYWSRPHEKDARKRCKALRKRLRKEKRKARREKIKQSFKRK